MSAQNIIQTNLKLACFALLGKPGAGKQNVGRPLPLCLLLASWVQMPFLQHVAEAMLS